jgi:hypothetical protein
MTSDTMMMTSKPIGYINQLYRPGLEVHVEYNRGYRGRDVNLDGGRFEDGMYAAHDSFGLHCLDSVRAVPQSAEAIVDSFLCYRRNLIVR